MKVIHDIPLKDIRNDQFGREPLVELIVSSINDVVKQEHPCLVYGIYGKWGEGKTTLMNFLKERLISQGKNDGIIIVEFNPWLVSNEEAMLTEFFKAIVADTDDTVRSAFKKYGSLAIFASKTIVNAMVPGIGTVLADGIELAKKGLEDSEDSLSELKKKATDAIVKSKRHLVVMIDDVDRLDRGELHAVLRLVRQVADFRNCIYLMAMDDDLVSKSICDYHGLGTVQDGRQFLDKIVQVPIKLPQIPTVDMERLVKEKMTKVLEGYEDEKTINEIAKEIEPFMGTYRDLKRYCNQLAFVLPHLKGEVNIRDLCLIEAVKAVSTESYDRIYERRRQLNREPDDNSLLFVNESESAEIIDKGYDSAVDYVMENLSYNLKVAVKDAIEKLFLNTPMDCQKDLHEKRFFTREYMPKYFSLKVPSDVLADRDVESLKAFVDNDRVEDFSKMINYWLKKYQPSEIRRAALEIILRYSEPDDICHAASVVAKSLSICDLAKGYSPYTNVEQDGSLAAFIPIQILHKYMFVLDVKTGGTNVCDEGLLNDTLVFVFGHAEMNFCLNFLTSSDNILHSEAYNGHLALPTLIERFKGLSLKEQFAYSKFLLEKMLQSWKQTDKKTFDEYATDLFNNEQHSCKLIFNKMIDGTEDGQDVINFVGLFKEQIPIINERLQRESEEVRSLHSVRVYYGNYKEAMR